MTIADAATCKAHADLLQAAEACRADLAKLDHEARLRTAREQDRSGARHMLHTTADHCQRATEAFTLDPTLADEAWLREVDALVELARQLRVLVRRVLTAPEGDGFAGRNGQPIRQMWHEAHLLAERAAVLADNVVARAHPDHDTVDGQHAISLTRLRDSIGAFGESLCTLRAALETALKLKHPHPRATAMRDLLDQLAEHVTAVQATNADEAGHSTDGTRSTA